MIQIVRRVMQGACGLWLIGAIVVVGWMANAIVRDKVDAFRRWNSLYDYIIVGGVVFSCLLLAFLVVTAGKRIRVGVIALGVSLLAVGILGHYGFQYLRLATLDPIPTTVQRKPNAANTVLGYHYLCPTVGGSVAFGDGSVRYVTQEVFSTLRHANTPDQTPEFISPIKAPPSEESVKKGDELPEANVLSQVQATQERIKHSNNLKQMANGHFAFRPRNGARVPLKPEHLANYYGMDSELRNGIADGTYVWYFGWEPSISYTAERTRALWYDYISWACVYLAGFGAGSLLAGLVLLMKRTATAKQTGIEPSGIT